MKQTVYIETTIFSYLTSRPSRNLVAAAWQQVTSDWWVNQRDKFELYISELVVTEAERGNPEAAARRLEQLQKISELSITEEVILFADTLVEKNAIPIKAADDAMHIAIAAIHGVDYLLTWNCRHIDNAETKPLIRKVCEISGYSYPEICTPQELMGETNNE